SARYGAAVGCVSATISAVALSAAAIQRITALPNAPYGIGRGPIMAGQCPSSASLLWWRSRLLWPHRRFCAEEGLHVARVAHQRHRRQAVEEDAAVGLGDQTIVTDHQHAAVGRIADQPADALPQGD